MASTEAAHDSQRPAVRSRRLRLWEIHRSFHCSVLGTCLPLSSVKKILRKVKIKGVNSACDYAIHCTAVDLARERDQPARLLDKALERLHKVAWDRYASLSAADAIREQWQKDVRSSTIAGSYWAVMHHPLSDESVLSEVFGVVHMLSHQVGGSHRSQLRRADDFKRRLREAEERLNQEKRIYSAKIEALRADTSEIEQRLVAAHAECLQWRRRAERADTKNLQVLEEERSSAVRSLKKAERQLDHAQLTIERLTDERAELKAAIAELKSELRSVSQPAQVNSPPQTVRKGTSCDLRGCTVLYVGGEKRMVPHLKTAATSANGTLLYHDGGIEDSIRALSGLCARADFVVCPVEKVGHMAVEHVKLACRTGCKRFVPLRRASLDAFAQELFNIANSFEADRDRSSALA
ncbi:MAG: DUF2325 domain-containing protein [Myxococcota bacterium]